MTIIGVDVDTGNLISVSESYRRLGLYCIGANGTGKTNLLLSFILQDISEGLGVCVLDPHGDLTTDIITRLPSNRVEDVILLDPLDTEYPFGLNLFACTDTSTTAIEHSVNQIIQVFEKVFGASMHTPRLNQFIRNIAYTLVGTPYTMVEIPHLLLDKAFRDKVLGNGNSNTSLFWKSFENLRASDQLERAESTLDRIDSLISSPITRNIVGQSKTTINFRAIMDEGKILLVQLPARYESLTSLLGSIIIGQLLTAALSRSTTSIRPQFNLYADEYQRFATPDFATLLTEARKFNIATTLAHQTLSQIDERNKAASLQAGTLVVFKVNGDDAKELSSSFDCTPPPPLLDKREKVLTIAEDVVGTLMALHGYSSPYVSTFVDKYLRTLVDSTTKKVEIEDRSQWQLPAVYTYPRLPEFPWPSGFSPESLKEQLKVLNQFLFTVMETRNSEVPIPISFVREFGTVFDFTGNYSHGEFSPILKRPLNTMSMDEFLELVCNPDFRLEEGRKQYKSVIHVQHWKYKDNEWVDRMFDFLLCFREFLRELVKEPLMVDSGKWELKPGTQRTYNDMQNEIASSLANLPRYTAHVKTEGSEHTITTLPPAPAWGDYRGVIQERTRQEYCRTRSEVEEEIAKRVEPVFTPKVKPIQR